jgi:nucleoside 2-deoxyribosyltransferase
MSARASLINEDRIIYVATRLFNYSDKLLAERLEAAVKAGVRRAMPDLPSMRSDPFTFVPFRDTGEHLITGPNKAKIIYDGDKQRLERLFALIGFYDGPSKDEGMGFEIGYAFGKGVPVILILTDFFHFVSKFDEGYHFAVDPVLEAMTTELIWDYELNPALSFPDSLEAGLSHVLSRAEDAMYALCTDLPRFTEPQPLPQVQVAESRGGPVVYLDFGGGMYEWQRRMQAELAERLRQWPTVQVKASTRFDPQFAVHNGAGSLSISSRLAQRDIAAAASADVVVVCGDNDEMSAGAAALQGFAAAHGKTIILYDSRPFWWRSDDGLSMSRNLMLDQSATVCVSQFDAIPEVLLQHLSFADH